jgi:predicted HicB family RNase H-like nuclease
MTPKPTRGGARKGAGRKPRTIPRKSITVRLEPQDADRLRELCRAQELSQANWIAKQIRKENLA